MNAAQIGEERAAGDEKARVRGVPGVRENTALEREGKGRQREAEREKGRKRKEKQREQRERRDGRRTQ